MSEKFLLFVYGTLRTEYGSIGSRVRSDRIKGCLFDLGAFPGYYPFKAQDEEGNPVEMYTVGEVLEVPLAYLPSLDKYEGVNRGLYTRETIVSESGLECQVYQCNPQFALAGTLVMSGDWFERDLSKSPKDLTNIDETQEERAELQEETSTTEAEEVSTIYNETAIEANPSPNGGL